MSIQAAPVRRLFAFLSSALALVLVVPFWGCSPTEGASQQEVNVEITHPRAGEYVTNRRTRVRGQATGVAEVEVNGRTTNVTGGAWEVLVEFDEGPVTATATAKSASSSVNFFVDSVAPTLVLESPMRGMIRDETEGAEIQIVGTVSDQGSGLFIVKVNEQIIEPDTDGRFSHSYTLRAGYNEFAVAAIDKANNETIVRRAAIFGPLVEPTSRMQSAFRMNISPDVFPTVATVVEEVITPELVMGLVEANFDSEAVTITSITFDPVDVEVVPRDGYLEANLLINNLRIEGEFVVNNEPISTYIEVTRMEVRVDISLTATDAGGLEVQIVDSSLALNENDIHSDFTDDSQVLRNLVVVVAQAAFAEYVGDLLIEELYDPAILTRRVVLLERTLEFELLIESVLITTMGIQLNLAMEMPQGKFEAVPDAPGALHRAGGPRTPPGVSGNMMVSTWRTTLDRISHGAWYSGLLHQRLEGNAFAGITLPFELTASGLAALLDPRITTLADSDTPAGIVMRPLLPPVTTFVPGDSGTGIELQLGEFLIDFNLMHPDRAHETLLTLALFLDLGVDVEMIGADLRLDFSVTARSEVAAEPLIDFDDDKLIGLIAEIVELIPQIASANLLVTAEADLPWVKLKNLKLDLHGQAFDQLSAAIDLEANPEGLGE